MLLLKSFRVFPWVVAGGEELSKLEPWLLEGSVNILIDIADIY
jgi:hypothetical protein